MLSGDLRVISFSFPTSPEKKLKNKKKQRRLKSVNIESKSFSRRQIHKIKTLQKTKNKITNKCHESDINKPNNKNNNRIKYS